MNMKRFFALLLALVLCLTPLSALAETYDVSEGSITVYAEGDVQKVEQGGEVYTQTEATVITGTSTGSGANTVTVNAEAGQTINIVIRDLTINTREDPDKEDSDGGAALLVNAGGSVTVELEGNNSLTSGEGHAGMEKEGTGALTIGDEDGDGSLTAAGGEGGAGIGGGYKGDGTDITISGGTISATGGRYGAGIGGGG